jgi:hypothetical protein
MNWFLDWLWCLTHRKEIAHIQNEWVALEATSNRLEKTMIEDYGPDWRKKAEERLKVYMVGEPK